ncbi:peroxisomal N(1)-acetyl-spermine/spermidine oxidase [Ascaphus truei]|uniref:peroxisomal N(1)-acetyl-spermine/spermidine oxidase n=1 Tax=Ascaphus truei TaxID=8439 RepID=UPI003F5A71CB
MDPSGPVVLIVGSGISGLGAAQKLHRHGFRNLRVLEATGRTGGRIRSQKYGRGLVEIGAQWIHGPCPDNPVFQLSSQHGLLGQDALNEENQRLEVAGHPSFFPVTYLSSGSQASPELVGSVLELFSSWLERSREVPREGCDPASSVGEFLRQEIARSAPGWDSGCAELRMAVLSALLSVECCVSGTHSMDRVALCPFGEYKMLPGLDCTFPGGYESLVTRIKSSLPSDTVLLNKAVKTVHWDGSFRGGGGGSRAHPVQVECEDGGTFVADHVIVTVPLGFLKERALGFLQPPLPPHKVRAIQNMGFGTNNKIILEFEEPFWEPECHMILLVWEGESPLRESQRDLQRDWVKKLSVFVVLQPPEQLGHVLCGFIAGEESEFMETLTDAEILSSMTAMLRQFTGNPQLRPPISVLCSRWRSEVYSRGSYSYVAVGSSGRDVDILAQPLPEERDAAKSLQVLFAGEATHRSFYSTTHGALLSGWREAGRLIGQYPKLDPPLSKPRL